MSSLEPGSWPPNWLQGNAAKIKKNSRQQFNGFLTQYCKLIVKIENVMESLESLVMRLSEAALAGNINHQDHLPGELRELDLGHKYWGEN